MVFITQLGWYLVYHFRMETDNKVQDEASNTFEIGLVASNIISQWSISLWLQFIEGTTMGTNAPRCRHGQLL